MPILNLKVSNIGPFDNIKFSFDRNINVFVGPNNCGKSTILSVLGDISTFPFKFPQKLLRREQSKFQFKYQIGKQNTRQMSGELPIHYFVESTNAKVYWTFQRWTKWCSFVEYLEYGMFLPAIRQSTDFRAKGPVPEKEDELKHRFLLKDPKTGKRTGYIDRKSTYYQEEFPKLSKKAKTSFTQSAYITDDKNLIQKIIELDYRAYRKKDTKIRKVVDKIAAISSEITEDFSIEFVGIGEDEDGLFPEFSTPDGIIPLNCLSQGTQSIIHAIAQIILGFAEFYDYPRDLETQAGILMIDEIDAHLHPSWQRRYLSTLKKHFPNLQIFCSTHSPLVLGGLKAGQIQLFRRSESGQITVSRNQSDISGWSVDEVLRGLLDISTPTDLDTETKLNRIQELQARKRLTKNQKDELEILVSKINEDLLEGSAAAQLKKLDKIINEITINSKTKKVQKSK